MQLSLSITNVG